MEQKRNENGMNMEQKMTIEVNIKDYLSDERIQEIAEEEVRESFRSQVRGETDVERVLTNLGYEFVFKIVKEEFDADLTELLKERMRKVITDTSEVEFAMFYKKEPGFHGDEGPATKIVEEECENLRPMIREKAEEHIDKYPFSELDRNEIAETVWEVINDKLFGKEDKS